MSPTFLYDLWYTYHSTALPREPDWAIISFDSGLRPHLCFRKVIILVLLIYKKGQGNIFYIWLLVVFPVIKEFLWQAILSLLKSKSPGVLLLTIWLCLWFLILNAFACNRSNVLFLMAILRKPVMVQWRKLFVRLVYFWMTALFQLSTCKEYSLCVCLGVEEHIS